NPPVSHIGLMYVRRYLRMTPVVMITLVFAVWLSVYIPTGVLHKAYWNQPTFQACKEQWWHQLLYITNLNDAAGWPDCMGWFWYLSTDFQLFLAAPLLVVPYFFDARAFLALMASGVIVITGLQTQLKYGAFLGDGSSYYDKPWMRANPYLFGMACAALVRSDHVKRLFATAHARWVSYVRRYLRMTPVVMITLVFAVWLSVYIPTGVLHKAYWNQPTFQACKEQWWHQLLYITNLNDAAGWPDCMGWFWYLSTDFQLFLAAPLLVVPYFFDARAFLALMASGVIVITGLQTQLKYGAFLGDGSSYYDKPWMRANPYLFGMACAALVRSDHVKRLFATAHARWVSYAAGTVLMVTCINVMWIGLKCFEQKLNAEVEECSAQFFQFLNSYAVSAWGLGMSCVALPWALSSKTGPIKWFLSTKPFAIASKLTFCCYMLHPIIILIVVAEGSQNPTFTPLIQYARFSGATVLTFFAAAILHLVVEVPFAKMNDALTRST
ncbi:acyltransferase, putative, partial [Bodo saltans]